MSEYESMSNTELDRLKDDNLSLVGVLEYYANEHNWAKVVDAAISSAKRFFVCSEYNVYEKAAKALENLKTSKPPNPPKKNGVNLVHLDVKKIENLVMMYGFCQGVAKELVKFIEANAGKLNPRDNKNQDDIDKHLSEVNPRYEDSQMKKDFEMNGIEFTRGFVCAIAIAVNQHDIGTIAEDALRECGVIDWSEMDSQDIEWLKHGGINLEKYGYNGERGK